MQKHLLGEVLTGDEILKVFEHDASLLKIKPLAVILARHEDDIRKTLIFLEQLAAKSRSIPLTIRGGGTDLTGAALSEGLILFTPAYLDRLLSFSKRQGRYCFEAGASIEAVKHILAIHGDFLPPIQGLPSQATLGGAVANNVSSRYSFKYGSMVDHVQSLKVILANGQVMKAERLSRSEVAKKVALDTFEGDIYRGLERLFNEESSPYYYKDSNIFEHNSQKPRILNGYNLSQLYQKDGSINLEPLFSGSQGTLGVITEVEFYAQTYQESQSLLFVCPNFKTLVEFMIILQECKPASLSFVNEGYLAARQQLREDVLGGFLTLKKGQCVLIAEFDDFRPGKRLNKARELAQQYNLEVHQPLEEENILDQLRSSLDLIYAQSSSPTQYIYGGLRHAYIPNTQLITFYRQAQMLCQRWQTDFIAFGELGFGGFSLLPRFELQTVAQRKRFLKFLDEYHSLVFAHQGRLSLERQEGLLLGLFLKKALGDQDYKLMQSIKKLFDPYGILNPKAKFQTEKN